MQRVGATSLVNASEIDITDTVKHTFKLLEVSWASALAD